MHGSDAASIAATLSIPKAAEKNIPVLEDHEAEQLEEPREDEIREYAEWLGMDPDEDADLLWIARQGLCAPLQAPWKLCQSSQGDMFYFNTDSGKSSWDHPCDEGLRELYAAERLKKSKKKQQSEEAAAPPGSSSKSCGSGKSTTADFGPPRLPEIPADPKPALSPTASTDGECQGLEAALFKHMSPPPLEAKRSVATMDNVPAVPSLNVALTVPYRAPLQCIGNTLKSQQIAASREDELPPKPLREFRSGPRGAAVEASEQENKGGVLDIHPLALRRSEAKFGDLPKATSPPLSKQPAFKVSSIAAVMETAAALVQSAGEERRPSAQEQRPSPPQSPPEGELHPSLPRPRISSGHHGAVGERDSPPSEDLKLIVPTCAIGPPADVTPSRGGLCRSSARQANQLLERRSTVGKSSLERQPSQPRLLGTSPGSGSSLELSSLTAVAEQSRLELPPDRSHSSSGVGEAQHEVGREDVAPCNAPQTVPDAMDQPAADTKDDAMERQQGATARVSVQDSWRVALRYRAELQEQELAAAQAIEETRRCKSELASSVAKHQELQRQVSTKDAELGRLRTRVTRERLSEAAWEKEWMDLNDWAQALEERERYLNERELAVGEAQAAVSRRSREARAEFQAARLARLRTSLGRSTTAASSSATSRPQVARAAPRAASASSDSSTASLREVRALAESGGLASARDETKESLNQEETMMPEADPALQPKSSSNLGDLGWHQSGEVRKGLKLYLRARRRELRTEQAQLEEERRRWRADSREQREHSRVTAASTDSTGGALLSQRCVSLDSKALAYNEALADFRKLEEHATVMRRLLRSPAQASQPVTVVLEQSSSRRASLWRRHRADDTAMASSRRRSASAGHLRVEVNLMHVAAPGGA